MDRLLTDLIPFDGDKNTCLLWDNFTNFSGNCIRKLLIIMGKEEDWQFGLSYSHLEGLHVSDLDNLSNITEMNKTLLLVELKKVFANFEREGPGGSIATAIEFPQEEEAELDEVDVAETLAELVNAVLEAFNMYRKFDEKTESILRGRIPALMYKLRTLDDIGQEFGVSRERIRQIESKYVGLTLSFPKVSNSLLHQILSILEKSANEEEFLRLSNESGLLGGEPISLQKFRALLKFCNLDNYLVRAEIVDEKWAKAKKDWGQLSTLAQKSRNKFGLIDLSYLTMKQSVSDVEAFNAIRSVYPRSIMKGNLVLARTNAIDTGFENVLGKQLLAFGTLSAENLLLGIERQARFRKVAILGNQAEQIALIKEIAGEFPNYEKFRENTVDQPELSDTDTWLIEQFEQSPTGMLHRNEITAAAIRDERNVSSIGIFLLFNPLIRPVGVAVMAPANLVIDPEMARQYANITKSLEEKTLLEYSFSDDKIVLTIRPNINTIAAGVLFPTVELRDMIKNTNFRVLCRCGLLDTQQQLRLRSPNFWTGFTAGIKHAMNEHDYKKDSDLKILLDFESKTALLLLG